MSLVLVRLDTRWGSFHVARDAKGRLYCPVCKKFTVYSAKDLVYHIAYHVSFRNGERRKAGRLGRW